LALFGYDVRKIRSAVRTSIVVLLPTAPSELSSSEEALWRATMRIVTVLPSHLDADLVHGAGLTASEYITLVNLSEAANHELRMTDLAKATGLSASRTTRLVDDLQGRGLVAKVASSSDARSTRARIMSNGHGKAEVSPASSAGEPS